MAEKVFDEIQAEVKGVAELVKGQAEAQKEVSANVELTQKQLGEVAAQAKLQQEQLDNLTAAIQKSGMKGEDREGADVEIAYTNAFIDVVRGKKSTDAIRSELGEYKSKLIDVATKNGDTQTVAQLKSMATDSLAAGGVLVPVQMANRITELQRDFSDVRRFADVQRTDTTGLILPSENGDMGFGWTGERETRTTTDENTFASVEIPVNEARAKVAITNQMMMNSSFDMGAWITRKAAERLARGEGAAFVTGDGHKKPKGFMSYDHGTTFGTVQQIETIGSQAISHKDFTNIKTQLRGGYRNGARYFMNRFVEGIVEKLDDDQGNPLFNRGNLAAQIPSSIKGYPVQIFDDMAGADTLAAGSLVVLYANMQEFYTVVDHTMSMLMYVDPYTGGDSGITNYRFHKFVGGGVKNFEAGKILKVKA